MGVRVWFGVDDVARTRVAAPDPLAETIYSTVMLRDERPASRPLDQWHHRTRTGLTPRAAAVADLTPTLGPPLDLPTVAGSSTSLDEGLDQLLSAPAAVLDGEISYFAKAHRQIPPRLTQLLPRGNAAPTELVGALREYHRHAIEPFWPHIHGQLDAAIQRAASALLGGGLATLFARIGGLTLRWEPPVLRVRCGFGAIGDCDIELGGRGLILTPSVFLRKPFVFSDPTAARPSLLVYPVESDPFHREPRAALVELLGATRASVLSAAATGCSTTQLARWAGCSPSSASEHAGVLRRSGLLDTQRRGSAVRHTLTSLGRRLLDDT